MRLFSRLGGQLVPLVVSHRMPLFAAPGGAIPGLFGVAEPLTTGRPSPPIASRRKSDPGSQVWIPDPIDCLEGSASNTEYSRSVHGLDLCR